MTLWSEWCVPCPIEARDLAAARPSVVGDGFDIVSLLSGSVAKLDQAGAAARLAKAGALGLTLLIEPNGGHAVVDVLAADPAGGYSLPCTVLVDRLGHVRGRATGVAVMHGAPRFRDTAPAAGPRHLSDAVKQAMMGGGTKIAWASSDGEAFLLALRGGLLDRV